MRPSTRQLRGSKLLDMRSPRLKAALVSLAFAALVCGQQKLSVDTPSLHQFEDGPEIASGYEFVPGETVYFSCRVAGYQILKKEEAQSVKLSWQMRAVDAAGALIVKEESKRLEDAVSSQDKNWKPKFSTSLIVPGFAPSGTYKISVTVKDEVAGAETTTEIPFRVHGHDVEPSDKLIARNFQFLRAEDDKVPMRSAIYSPGDSLWARFDITGYKFGDNNRFSVDYGLAILDATDKQVFAQPSAAADSNTSFYPQRYVPGALTLHLDQNVPKGQYTLLITIEDKIGNQTYETRQPFRIE
jgi:hypothetical protein